VVELQNASAILFHYSASVKGVFQAFYGTFWPTKSIVSHKQSLNENFRIFGLIQGRLAPGSYRFYTQKNAQTLPEHFLNVT
jgi:hypothetical protein